MGRGVGLIILLFKELEIFNCRAQYILPLTYKTIKTWAEILTGSWAFTGVLVLCQSPLKAGRVLSCWTEGKGWGGWSERRLLSPRTVRWLRGCRIWPCGGQEVTGTCCSSSRAQEDNRRWGGEPAPFQCSSAEHSSMCDSVFLAGAFAVWCPWWDWPAAIQLQKGMAEMKKTIASLQ